MLQCADQLFIRAGESFPIRHIRRVGARGAFISAGECHHGSKLCVFATSKTFQGLLQTPDVSIEMDRTIRRVDVEVHLRPIGICFCLEESFHCTDQSVDLIERPRIVHGFVHDLRDCLQIEEIADFNTVVNRQVIVRDFRAVVQIGNQRNVCVCDRVERQDLHTRIARKHAPAERTSTIQGHVVRVERGFGFDTSRLLFLNTLSHLDRCLIGISGHRIRRQSAGYLETKLESLLQDPVTIVRRQLM